MDTKDIKQAWDRWMLEIKMLTQEAADRSGNSSETEKIRNVN